VSSGDTGEKISGTGAVGDTADGRRGIDSDAVTGLCGENYGNGLKERDTANTKYFLL